MALVKSEVKGEIRIIFLNVPRLMDQATIDQCFREMVELLGKTEEKHVLLHFGMVAFMSSMALGMLIRLHKKCKEFKISLKLCAIKPDIYEVFKITGLNKVFSIYADVPDAMEAFKASGDLFFRTHQETRRELT